MCVDIIKREGVGIKQHTETLRGTFADEFLLKTFQFFLGSDDGGFHVAHIDLGALHGIAFSGIGDIERDFHPGSGLAKLQVGIAETAVTEAISERI